MIVIMGKEVVSHIIEQELRGQVTDWGWESRGGRCLDQKRIKEGYILNVST